MHSHKNGRPNPARTTRSFELSPITRAVRAVLVGSAIVLVAASGGVAYAGTCADTVPNTVSCNGDFTATIPDNVFAPAADLSLVLGDDAPTSVIPAAGAMGIEVIRDGNVGVISGANIVTEGKDGPHLQGSTLATWSNDGSFTTHGADAVDISANGDVSVTNGGKIVAYSATHDVTAVVGYSSAGNVSVNNLATGTVSAHALDGVAYAIDVSAGVGDLLVTNAGDIAANSVHDSAAGPEGTTAIAIYAHADRDIGDTTIINSGNITAEGGFAAGIIASSDGRVSVSNTGTIVAHGVISTDDPVITYIPPSCGYFGCYEPGYSSSYVGRGGYVSSSSPISYAIGILAGPGAGDLKGLNSVSYVDNAGTIALTNTCGDDPFCLKVSIGISASTVTNSGSISIDSDPDSGFSDLVFGIRGQDGYAGEPIRIDNSGSITIDAIQPTGISVNSIRTSVASIVNSGDILVTGSRSATGIYGLSPSAIDIVNSGAITVDSPGTATGIVIVPISGEDGIVDNTGSITANTREGFGIAGKMGGGDLIIDNSGDLAVDTTFRGKGVDVASGLLTAGNTFVGNSGAIVVGANVAAGSDSYANAYGGRVLGIAVQQINGDISVGNSGSIDAALYSYSYRADGFVGLIPYGATGITVYSASGASSISNTGSITASSEVHSQLGATKAVGIEAAGYYSGVDIFSSGAISATAQSDDHSDYGQTLAVGIRAKNRFGDIGITNTGVITVDSSTLLYNSAAAIGIDASTVVGLLDVVNIGDITATAHSEAASHVYGLGDTTATGIALASPFGTDVILRNGRSGAITANAFADHYGGAFAAGINAVAYAGTLDIANAGRIAAVARADEHSDEGAMATASGVLSVNDNPNGGVIRLGNHGGVITADASGYTSALAQGVAITGSRIDLKSSGVIGAWATADDAQGQALATGVTASGGTATVMLDPRSQVVAAASGYDGTAIGLLVSADHVTASNAGLIYARFTGTAGSSYGALIASGGDVRFINSGEIAAIGANAAVGVQLGSASATTLINSGSIVASSPASGGIAVLTGDSADLIRNTGRLDGALVTNGGNDRLDNGAGGIWNAVGTSDFGAGADRISNTGTINLQNAAIILGSHVDSGNRFSNSGLITVSGDNRIDLGAQNPKAFINNGAIDFRDGMQDDRLTIVGDFGGYGEINLDVSALKKASDVLYIDGNVAKDSMNTINVALADLRAMKYLRFKTQIPVMYVSGDSTARSFALGDVLYNQAGGFLSLAFSSKLIADIDRSNATDDVFSLAVAVKGLNSGGKLAASIAPGVQGLMASQAGSLSQRVSLLDGYAKGGLSAWIRQDSGALNPAQVTSSFGEGSNFGFDQRNSSSEAGVGFAISDELSLGVLLARAEASQRLSGGDVGLSKINGGTYGLYGTWVSPLGFYLDASYRRMSFEARLSSLGGAMQARGDAETFNLETGYAWTSEGGLTIEPQFQYTRTMVDNIDSLTSAQDDFQAEGGVSSRGRLGVMFRKNFAASASAAAWTPYASVSAVHEFDGRNAYAVNDALAGETDTAGTSALLEVGLNVDSGDLSLFGGANWQNGGALQSSVGAQLGLRYAW